MSHRGPKATRQRTRTLVLPEATLHRVYSWESQQRQYPRLGAPGISYYAGPMPQISPDYIVDCLLWRDDDGIVRGILNHYGMDGSLLEARGNVNIWVDPAWKRRGIATALITEAVRRWDIDPAQQRYTPEGSALVTALLQGARR